MAPATRIMKKSRTLSRQFEFPAAWKTALQKLQERLQPQWQAFWQPRTPRERLILSTGAAVFILAMLYLLLWEPAVDGRRALQIELPQLRSQLVEMYSLQQEARRLKAAVAAQPEAGALKEILTASLNASGIQGAQLQVTETTPPDVHLKIDAVDFAQWVGWLENMRRTYNLKPVELKIQQAVVANRENTAGVNRHALINDANTPATPGLVRVTALLRGPKS